MPMSAAARRLISGAGFGAAAGGIGGAALGQGDTTYINPYGFPEVSPGNRAETALAGMGIGALLGAAGGHAKTTAIRNFVSAQGKGGKMWRTGQAIARQQKAVKAAPAPKKLSLLDKLLRPQVRAEHATAAAKHEGAARKLRAANQARDKLRGAPSETTAPIIQKRRAAAAAREQQRRVHEATREQRRI